MRTYLALTSLGLAALVGCSSAPAPRTYETVFAVDGAPILAMASYRDGLLLARLGALQTFDPKTSTARQLTGPSYEVCPFAEGASLWPDLYYPFPKSLRLTSTGALELGVANCGVWRLDPEHADVETPILHTDRPTKTTFWGATPGPYMMSNFLPTLTADSGDETIVCAQVDLVLHEGVGTGSGAFEPAHLEIWSIDADGRAARPIFVPKWSTSTSAPIYPPEQCLGLAANRDDVFFVSSVLGRQSLSRVSRATGAVTELSKFNGLSSAPIETILAGDTLVIVPFEEFGTGGDDPSANYLPVLAVDLKTGMKRTLLHGVTRQSPVRYDFKVDGTELYWLDGLSLRRMPLAGGDVETIVEGHFDTGDGVFPDYAVLPDHVYFSHVVGHGDATRYTLMRTPK